MTCMVKPEFQCEVRVQFLPERSEMPDGPFAFAYTVTIRNTGCLLYTSSEPTRPY